MADFIYGHWAVIETLRASKRSLEQLILTETVEEKGPVGEIISMANERGVKIKRVPRRIIDDLANGANHQNTLLRVGPYPYADVENILSVAQERGEKPFILLLDLLKDPQNVGVLLQAVAFVVSGTLAVATGAPVPEAGEVLAGLAAGVGNAAGLLCFYRATQLGPLSLVTPIGALGAGVPVLAGLATGESASAVKLAGIALALAGTALAARGPGGQEAHADRSAAVAWAAASAVAFGLFLAAMAPAADGGVLSTQRLAGPLQNADDPTRRARPHRRSGYPRAVGHPRDGRRSPD